MESFYRETITVSGMLVDCFGRLKPSALLYLAQEMAGKHCVRLSLTWEDLAKKGMFWAVVRHRVQIRRMPTQGESITVETWPLPTTRVAYPRAMAAYDQQGQLLFQTVSLWVLMDMNTRAMVLPAKSGIEVPGTQRGTELAVPGSLLPKNLSGHYAHTVHFSQLDRNGHMNNTRYLDWVNDLLPSAFHKEHTVKEFVICYVNEAIEGNQIGLAWDLDESLCLQVDAHRQAGEEKTDRIFTARFWF